MRLLILLFLCALTGPAAAATPPAKIATVAANGMLDRKVSGPDGQEIGRVVDILVDGKGRPRAAVIDFGGFLGVGTRRVAVDWSALSFPPGGSDADLKLDLTEDQIKAAPAYTGGTQGAPVAETPPPGKPPAGAGAGKAGH